LPPIWNVSLHCQMFRVWNSCALSIYRELKELQINFI
jgi:hypothetical protein